LVDASLLHHLERAKEEEEICRSTVLEGEEELALAVFF